MKKMLSVLLAALLFSPSLYANQAQTPATQQTENREVLLYIKEMHCQLCVYLVNKELRAIEGVESTKADMKARQVKVVAAPNVTDAQLIESVKKINYTAEVRYLFFTSGRIGKRFCKVDRLSFFLLKSAPFYVKK